MTDTVVPDSADADRLLRLATANSQAMLDDITRAGEDPPGRSLRRALTFLAGRLGRTATADLATADLATADVATADLATAAAAGELNYLATWHHERIREHHAGRRDNSVAILAGDYLYTSAANLVAQLGIRAVESYAAMTARLVTGQLREALGPAPDENPVEHYRSAAIDKDGTLAATGPTLAVLVAGVPHSTANAMVELCRWMGVIQRTSRDLDAIRTGSRQPRAASPGWLSRSLPASHLRQSTDPRDTALLEVVRAGRHDDSALQEALVRLANHRAVDWARTDLDRYRAKARESLETLPPDRIQDRLGELLDVVAVDPARS